MREELIELLFSIERKQESFIVHSFVHRLVNCEKILLEISGTNPKFQN